MASVDLNAYNSYDEYLAAGNPENKNVKAFYGTKANSQVPATPTTKASNAGVGKSKEYRKRLGDAWDIMVHGKGGLTNPMNLFKGSSKLIFDDESTPTLDKIGKAITSIPGSAADLMNGVETAVSQIGNKMSNPDSGVVSDKTAQTEADKAAHTDDNGKPDEEAIWKNAQDSLGRVQKGAGLVDDYYGDSMAGMWKNLSDDDKRILLLDQIGTTLRNVSKYRPRMGSAFGHSYEGSDMGESKSLLQKGMEESFKKGLERRNERLDNTLQQQLAVMNFPSNLNMKAQELITSGKISNRQKRDLINVLATVKNDTALQAALTQNPTKLWEMALDAAGIAVSAIPFTGGVHRN